MTLRDFLSREYDKQSFDLDPNQIGVFRLVKSVDYEEHEDYSYNEMFCSTRFSQKTLKREIAFMIYNSRNSMLEMFLED